MILEKGISMKKLGMSLVLCGLLGFSFNASSQIINPSSQTKIIIKETPVMLEKQGEVYVVPSGSAVQYYNYVDTSSNTQYICTSLPVDITEVGSLPLSVSLNGTMTMVKCYPTSYFVVTPVSP